MQTWIIGKYKIKLDIFNKYPDFPSERRCETNREIIVLSYQWDVNILNIYDSIFSIIFGRMAKLFSGLMLKNSVTLSLAA